MSIDMMIHQVAQREIVSLRARVLSRGGRRVRGYSGDRGPRARHWASIIDDVVVGCVSVLECRGWALRGMAICPAHQRHGIGAQLLHTACCEVNAPMWCNARIEVVAFYGAHGWETEGPVFTMANGFRHQRMVWTPADLGEGIEPSN